MSTAMKMRTNRAAKTEAAVSVICQLCRKSSTVAQCRQKAKEKQKSQATKMLQNSQNRFCSAAVEDTVMVPIPEVDRGRAEFPNVKGIITNVAENGLYTIGTVHGVLKQLYSRNQFILCTESFMKIDEVKMNKEISLREAARLSSIGTGQGFFKCSCASKKQKCHNNVCKCRREKVSCNSKCHNSSPCSNKYE